MSDVQITTVDICIEPCGLGDGEEKGEDGEQSEVRLGQHLDDGVVIMERG